MPVPTIIKQNLLPFAIKKYLYEPFRIWVLVLSRLQNFVIDNTELRNNICLRKKIVFESGNAKWMRKNFTTMLTYKENILYCGRGPDLIVKEIDARAIFLCRKFQTRKRELVTKCLFKDLPD